MTVTMLIFGLLSVLAALGVVLSPKTLHSALFLVLTLFLVAVHFALLDAGFLAALQVMVYAGAIMVLVVFVIMLLGLDEPVARKKLELSNYFSAFAAVALAGILVFIGFSSDFQQSSWEKAAQSGTIPAPGTASEIGALLFTKFLYPFEVTSVLLLVAIIGAVVLAYDRKTPLPAGRGLKAKQKELAG